MSDDAWDVPVVDCHVHVFTTDMPMVANPRTRPTYSFTAENLLETLDKNGVTMAVIAAASPWGDYNDYIVASVRRYPRLRGTVILQPTVDRVVLEDMKRAGVVGVRMHVIGTGSVPDVTTPEYRRFLKRIADLDWHVHPHIEGKDIPQLLPGLEASGVKIVIDHIGRPHPADRLDSPGLTAIKRSIDRGRTWVKLSAASRLGPNAMDHARELVRHAGRERLMWGSDCPFVGEEDHLTYPQAIAWLKECVPDARTRRAIACDTPLKFYFS